MPIPPFTGWTEIVRGFSTTRVLVVGDCMLDRYWYGVVSRVSPEAPVVVVSKTHAMSAPGGAGNTAANIAAMGGGVILAGVCGHDMAAAELRAALGACGVAGVHLIEDPSRPTTLKTRVIAHHQHVVRIDEESSLPLPTELQTRLLDAVAQYVAGVGVMVISDYAKGVLTESCIQGLIARAQACHVPVLIDPKARDARRYRGATLLKPNRGELSALTGAVIGDHAGTLAAAARLLDSLPGTSLLVTEGAEGMTLFRPGSPPESFSGLARALYDVTGAGDTVMAAFALALAASADWTSAAHIANHAAARVVEKLGTATCTAGELLASLGTGE